MLTAEQKETRRKYLGSSDLPAILGLDPFRSRMDVWLEKTGRVKDFDGNAATRRGNLLESALIDFVELTTNASLARNVMRVHEDGLRAANFDGIGTHDGLKIIAEAKSTGISEGWGEEGTDEVPDKVMAQTHHQFSIAGDEFLNAFVPVLMPGYRSLEFKLYRIRRNNDLVKIIEDRGVDFMEKHVKTDTPPEDAQASMETLERALRTPHKIVDVADELVERWQELNAQRLALEKEEKAAKAAVLQQLGDAEGGNCGLGDVTYFEQTRAAYQVKESKFRVLRLKQRRSV